MDALLTVGEVAAILKVHPNRTLSQKTIPLNRAVLWKNASANRSYAGFESYPGSFLGIKTQILRIYGHYP